jgi:hypothetical protein
LEVEVKLMRLMMTDRDVVQVMTMPEYALSDVIDNPSAVGPTITIREIILRPGYYQGRRVLRGYDRDNDTLYIKAKP